MSIQAGKNGEAEIAMIIDKVFFDTDILIYALDRHYPRKREKAQSLIRSLNEGIRGVISTQVMQEFYMISTRILGIERLKVKGILTTFEIFENVIIDAVMINEAVNCSIINQMSFRDSLAVISAERATCDRMLSEGLTDGQIIRGVRIENPF